MTDSDINHLCPELLILYREWLMRCHAAGLAVRVTVTYRDAIEQNAAFAKGLSKAKAGQSPHNCVDANGHPASKAFDFACFDEHARYITNGQDDHYRHAGEIGKELGLVWGGDFKNFKDFDHLELKNWRNT